MIRSGPSAMIRRPEPSVFMTPSANPVEKAMAFPSCDQARSCSSSPLARRIRPLPSELTAKSPGGPGPAGEVTKRIRVPSGAQATRSTTSPSQRGGSGVKVRGAVSGLRSEPSTVVMTSEVEPVTGSRKDTMRALSGDQASVPPRRPSMTRRALAPSAFITHRPGGPDRAAGSAPPQAEKNDSPSPRTARAPAATATTPTANTTQPRLMTPWWRRDRPGGIGNDPGGPQGSRCAEPPRRGRMSGNRIGATDVP
jgi:hypothetical protein